MCVCVCLCVSVFVSVSVCLCLCVCVCVAQGGAVGCGDPKISAWVFITGAIKMSTTFSATQGQAHGCRGSRKADAQTEKERERARVCTYVCMYLCMYGQKNMIMTGSLPRTNKHDLERPTKTTIS